MYIKKSILAGTVVAAGALLLFVVAFLFCFTESNVPSMVYAGAWLLCLGLISAGVTKISHV